MQVLAYTRNDLSCDIFLMKDFQLPLIFSFDTWLRNKKYYTVFSEFHSNGVYIIKANVTALTTFNSGGKSFPNAMYLVVKVISKCYEIHFVKFSTECCCFLRWHRYETDTNLKGNINGSLNGVNQYLTNHSPRGFDDTRNAQWIWRIFLH